MMNDLDHLAGIASQHIDVVSRQSTHNFARFHQVAGAQNSPSCVFQDLGQEVE